MILEPDEVSLPVSVVVPHLHSRGDFFSRYCLPSIKANLPSETLVIGNDGSRRNPAVFRNEGLAKAREEFVFFCDDDVVLASDCLSRLFFALKRLPAGGPVGFAYCDFTGICIPPGSHPSGPVFTHTSQEYNPRRLISGPYISPMVMVRRSVAVPFDETLPCAEDWDWFLTLADRGVFGVRVPMVLFHAYFMDDSCLSKEQFPLEVLRTVKRKHGIHEGL